MKSSCTKAGINYFRYHVLRHFGASVLANNVPIKTIQDILGHENRSTTEIYIHSKGESGPNAIKIFDTMNDELVEKLSHKFTHQDKAAGCKTRASEGG